MMVVMTMVVMVEVMMVLRMGTIGQVPGWSLGNGLSGMSDADQVLGIRQPSLRTVGLDLVVGKEKSVVE